MTAAVAHIAGSRIALFLQREYERPRAKLIANDFSVDDRTAKSWLKTGKVSPAHWHAMVQRWGRRFIAFVYEPEFDWARQMLLADELERAEARLAELRLKLEGNTDAASLVGEVRAVAHGTPAQAGTPLGAPGTAPGRGGAR